jgi:thiol-disulfide isomerase/thioredoxin
MGKQARLKRERRQQRVQSPSSARRDRSGVVFWVALVALVAVAAAVAVLLGRGDGDSVEPGANASPVSVQGEALPPFDSEATLDPAVGMRVPTVSGSDLDGAPLTVPDGAAPYVLVVLAHWCPHCQNEVPLLVDWMRAGEAPDEVAFFAVATANDSSAENYPADAWLEREGWDVPTLLDDDDRSAANALGTTGFPYFVFVDRDGEVAGRHAGELGVEALEERIADLRG